MSTASPSVYEVEALSERHQNPGPDEMWRPGEVKKYLKLLYPEHSYSWAFLWEIVNQHNRVIGLKAEAEVIRLKIQLSGLVARSRPRKSVRQSRVGKQRQLKALGIII